MELNKKKKKGINATMSYFPEEILEGIFLRLPRKYLMRFRCLSKFYYALFGSRSFQNMHHELITLRENPWVVLYEDNHNKMHTIDYKLVSSLLSLSPSSAATMRGCHKIVNQIEYPSIFKDYPNDKARNLSSCRGLHLMRTISKSSFKEFYIWNTVTEECKKIPMAHEIDYNRLSGYGFGYDEKTHDYKFIIVADRDMKCSDVAVYSLGSNSWKRIQSLTYSLKYPNYSYEGVKFNGALHWLAHTFEEGYKYTNLVCFDIANESFKKVPLPQKPMPYPEDLLEEDMFQMRLKYIEGCLSLVFHVFSVRIDVWMMQEYGVKESWVKIFSSTLDKLTTSRHSTFIWYFKNNETLWRVDHDGDLVLYDPNNKTYRKLILDSDSAEGLSGMSLFLIILH